MSTNAAIGMTMPDGTIKAVYLHWDGYIANSGAGETLAEHYKDRAKVEKLIALGFLSSLGAKVDPDPATPHSWANPQPGVIQQEFSYADGGNARFIAPRADVVVYDDDLPKRITDAS